MKQNFPSCLLGGEGGGGCLRQVALKLKGRSISPPALAGPKGGVVRGRRQKIFLEKAGALLAFDRHVTHYHALKHNTNGDINVS